MKIFTTTKINKLLDDERKGYGISRANSFVYQKLDGTRKSGIKFLMTHEEMIEWSKCYHSVSYFAEKYCKIRLENSFDIGPIQLRDYQKKMLQFVNEKRFSILFCSRQIGKTVVLSIYFLHMMLFGNKKILILPNKNMMGREFIRKMKDIYKLLPFFLKQGIINWGENSLVFENGSRIMKWGTRLNKGEEFVFPDDTDIILLNEMARYPYHLQKPIYIQIIQKLKVDGRIIIDSTGYGHNFFYELLRDSERPIDDPQKNIFTTMRAYWYQVPGRMDTKITFMENRMKELGLNTIDVIKFLNVKGYNIYEKEKTYFIKYDYNDDKTHIWNIREMKIGDNFLRNFALITNWQEEETDKVGESTFREEYDLQFIVIEKKNNKKYV